MQIIGGKYKKRRLFAPKTPLTRPTTSKLRESLFNICQHQIIEARFLDLFAGSGMMGFEALSRGASHVTFVEKRGVAAAAIKKNIALLHEESHTTVLTIDVHKALPQLNRLSQLFDLIYVDPPYASGLSDQVLDFIDTHPLLAKQGRLFIEEGIEREYPLKQLHLKSCRKMGRSVLQEYEYRTHRRDL